MDPFAQMFEQLKRWSEECFSPSLREERKEAGLISAEEATFNSYQRKILGEIRELAEHGPSELWIHSLERVNCINGFSGAPGIVLRQKVDDELHVIGVYQDYIKDKRGLTEPIGIYFVKSFIDGNRLPQLELDDSVIACRMFNSIKARSPFISEAFELSFGGVEKVLPGSVIAVDIVSIFQSSAFQLILKDHAREDPRQQKRRRSDQIDTASPSPAKERA
jgi:hypothetical protein